MENKKLLYVPDPVNVYTWGGMYKLIAVIKTGSFQVTAFHKIEVKTLAPVRRYELLHK